MNIGELLNHHGWCVECESPLEIVHVETGSRATGIAAVMVSDQIKSSTPAAMWRENGEEDPHGTDYDCERAKLCRGDLTDDQLANEVYLNPGIANLTAAKERIRWLSRQLENTLTVS